MKAKYVGKSYGTGFDRDFVYLEYEYRGYRYEVYENRAKGNEPLSWQHKGEQARIDKIIEMKEMDKKRKDVKPIDMDEIFEMLGW